MMPLLHLSCALFPKETLNDRGFGTDLPSVNGQVEEHNIFHNEVMAIGPHINKEGEKVSPPVSWIFDRMGSGGEATADFSML